MPPVAGAHSRSPDVAAKRPVDTSRDKCIGFTWPAPGDQHQGDFRRRNRPARSLAQRHRVGGCWWSRRSTRRRRLAWYPRAPVRLYSAGN